MATLASLAGMLGQMPQIRPWDVATRSQTEADTGLIKLAQLKQSQASEEELMLAIKNDPELRQRLFGDSILGSLQTKPGGPPPGGAPMTQQSLMPGQLPGAPQMVPGGQDLSRYANVSPQGGGPLPPDVMAQTMPTVTPPPGGSVLGSLGPQGGMPGAPQGPPQATRNPVLEMARNDPRVAMMLQQQIEQRQDRQWKMQEQGLSNRIKVVDYLARMAQGATDQDSWKQFIEEADRVQPGAGGRLPQMYSKEARDRIVAQGLDAKESMTLQVADLQAQAAVIKARKEGRATDVDNQLRGMGVQPGQESPDQMREALRLVQEGKKEVSAAQGSEAARIERTEKPLEGEAAKAVSDLSLLRTMMDDVAALRTDAFTGPIVGRTGYLREQAGQMDKQETAFRSTLKNVTDILGRLRSGANIPAPEMANLERLAPSVNDPPEVFQAKLQSFTRALEQQRESRLRVGTTGRQQLREEAQPTTPRVGEKPQGQAPAPSSGMPVGQMSKEALLAEKAAILARGGK